jgi:hypothetical protein
MANDPATDPKVCIEMRSVLIAARTVRAGLLDLDAKARVQLLAELDAYAERLIEDDLRAHPETWAQNPDGTWSLVH